jgi:hypothetical protein
VVLCADCLSRMIGWRHTLGDAVPQELIDLATSLQHDL